MYESQKEQLDRLILHSFEQKWALAVMRGSELIYPHQDGFLTANLVESHLKGDLTLGVMLLQPGTNTAKAGCIDIDVPRDAPNLKDALRLAQKVQEAALTKNLVTYIEFSGNRGFHLWLFASSPLPGRTWITSLKYLAKLAGFEAKEIFPCDALNEYKCIKLPGALHPKSKKRAGFIGDDIIWGDDGFPVLPEQGNLMSRFVQNLPEAIAQGVSFKHSPHKSELDSNPESPHKSELDFNSESPRKSELDFNSENGNKAGHEDTPQSFANFPPDEHPSCIQHLLKFGAPFSLDYNAINITLTRYTLTREFELNKAIEIAHNVARATPENHPTSKDTHSKIENFKSVYKTGERKDYQWKCSYILAGIKTRNPDELTSRGCIGEKCAMWPYPYKPFSIESDAASQEKPLALNAAIWQALTLLVAEGKEIRISTILTSLCAFSIPDCSPAQVTPAQELREKEVLAYILQHPESMVEAIALDIPSAGFIVTTNTDLKNYLEELATLSTCKLETFFSYLSIIRETGIRKLAGQKTTEATLDYKDNTKSLPETLNTLISSSQNFLMRTVSEVQAMEVYSHDLITDLFSKSLVTIPTPSLWLNNVLNGGLVPGKLYVIGAPPGGGKTTFCNWIGDYVAMNKTPVLVAAYEMSRHNLWIYSLARLAEINSALIEGKRWLDNSYQAKDTLITQVVQATDNYHYKIAPYISIQECGAEYTTAKLKGAIAQLRHRLKVAADAPVLVIVDYLQLMLSGEEKLDNSANETLRVSRIATDLKRLARDTKSAVLAISDVTKAAYIQALNTGSLDMSALRDSFKIAHAADAIALLQTGKITVGKGDEAQSQDQLALAALKYPADKQRLIQQARKTYPLNEGTKDSYARLTILKNRGGMLAEPLFVYQKALHRFQPINLSLNCSDDEESI